MSKTEPTTPVCPIHGSKLKRATCLRCNAVYMAAYQRRRRRSEPALALLERAKRRAKRAGIRFRLDRSDIVLPPTCPAFGTPLVVGQPRSGASPYARSAGIQKRRFSCSTIVWRPWVQPGITDLSGNTAEPSPRFVELSNISPSRVHPV